MGTCPTWRGKVTGSLPPGFTSPKSTSAMAGPACVPANHVSRMAGEFSAAQFIVSVRRAGRAGRRVEVLGRGAQEVAPPHVFHARAGELFAQGRQKRYHVFFAP